MPGFQVDLDLHAGASTAYSRARQMSGFGVAGHDTAREGLLGLERREFGGAGLRDRTAGVMGCLPFQSRLKPPTLSQWAFSVSPRDCPKA